MDDIERVIAEHQKALNLVSGKKDKIREIADIITDCLNKGHKLLIMGNGGSAADSQHFAAEIIGRFQKERKALPAIALSTDTSILTVVGNDYGFDSIFSRQVEGLAKKDDVVICFSTSGNSSNIITALDAAKKTGCRTIGFLGRDGGILKNKCDVSIIIEIETTARVQEMHLMIYHIICELVEKDY